MVVSLINLHVYHFLFLELEEMSTQPVKKRGRQMSRSEAKFIAALIETHGTDYKVSAVGTREPVT